MDALSTYFHWFNPMTWVLWQELRDLHEYEADEGVISSGVNMVQYQLLLVKKAVGTRLYSMANGFDHSKLKNRIGMMLKKEVTDGYGCVCCWLFPWQQGWYMLLHSPK